MKNRRLEIGEVYEFLGEIDQNKNNITYLKARVIKESTMPHNKVVYEHSTDQINKMIESIFARKLLAANEKKKKEEAKA